MKLAFIGQDIAPLLPSFLTDMYQAGKAEGDLIVEEKNDAMASVLEKYGQACLKHSGLRGIFPVSRTREEVLEGADCVIYAGDMMASSRFRQDREALAGTDEEAPGLTDQARVNGGIGGLLHTLRQGSAILPLCESMQKKSPHALVLSLGQPVARTTELFTLHGFDTYGFGNSARRGPGGIYGMARALDLNITDVEAQWYGLPGFQFLTRFRNLHTGEDLMDRIQALVEEERFGRLPRRWLREYNAVSVGSGPEHAEWMPAQDDFTPDPNPQLSESVEHRKNRILNMNLVAQHGLEHPDGQIAQLTLLTRTPSERPVALALALLGKKDCTIQGVTMPNHGDLPGVRTNSMIEAPLCLVNGVRTKTTCTFSPELTDLMNDIAYTSHLAALAAMGDRSSLRECIELDPALDGLDRLYLQDVVSAMIRMHSDILFQYDDQDEDLTW